MYSVQGQTNWQPDDRILYLATQCLWCVLSCCRVIRDAWCTLILSKVNVGSESTGSPLNWHSLDNDGWTRSTDRFTDLPKWIHSYHKLLKVVRAHKTGWYSGSGGYLVFRALPVSHLSSSSDVSRKQVLQCQPIYTGQRVRRYRILMSEFYADLTFR